MSEMPRFVHTSSACKYKWIEFVLSAYSASARKQLVASSNKAMISFGGGISNEGHAAGKKQII
jgi:hypothetical protein